jgi:hypothetical protein
MRMPKRTVTLLSCACLCALSVLGVMRALRPPPSPLDHARAFAQTTRWLSEFGNPGGSPLYYWSAGNKITYFGIGQDGGRHLFQRPMAAPIDTPGQEGPIVRWRGGYPGQLSPDGKWFVEWGQNKRRQRIPTFVATEGGQRIVGKPTWGTENVWAPGDRHEMYCGIWHGTAAVDVYRPDSTPLPQIVFPGLMHFYAPQRVDASGRLVGFPDGSSIMHYADTASVPSVNYPFINMARVDLAHPTGIPEQWKVAVPIDFEQGTCLLSPSGDRILWIGHGDSTPILIRKLKSLFPGLRSSARISNHWLVSGLHGENMHEVAAYPIDLSRRGGQDLSSLPRWTADSQHISFVFRNTLYTRPVD